MFETVCFALYQYRIQTGKTGLLLKQPVQKTSFKFKVPVTKCTQQQGSPDMLISISLNLFSFVLD